ncbi:mechanosensitive ion channel family protein [Aliiroseovarius sp. 2305UL8-7]|uniref:mechanosensitive ion channel family protein n=1 Tax=Aliiroseovarius conchicola TaxID=3121637 RepID=UPI00352895C2
MNELSSLEKTLSGTLGHAPFGISWSAYLSAASIMLVALVLVWMIRPVLDRIAKRQAQKTERHLRKRLVDALVPPLRVIPLIVGAYFALHVLNLNGSGSVLAGLIMKTVVVAAVFWAIARLSSNTDLLWDRMNLNLEKSAQRWLGFAVQFLVLACGAAIILQMWNIPVAPLIGSLGVFGIAVGLAAKDLLSNLISGVLIMTEKRFGPGEWIKVDGVVEGTVEQINFRSTKIRRFDLSPVYVPNSALADNAMTNFSRMTYRRINWMVGLEYGTPPEKLEQIRDGVEQWLQNDDRICQPPEASLFVRVDSFGENSINLMIYCFTKTTVWSEWLKIKEEFALAMIPIVKGAGSGFAFPTRSVFLHQLDPPEIINPGDAGSVTAKAGSASESR